MTDFKCEICGEEFEYQQHCTLHHMATKHEKYRIIETEHVMSIKTKS